jgi:hypothetical protein
MAETNADPVRAQMIAALDRFIECARGLEPMREQMDAWGDFLRLVAHYAEFQRSGRARTARWTSTHVDAPPGCACYFCTSQR